MKISQRAQNVPPSATIAVTAKAKKLKADGEDVVAHFQGHFTGKVAHGAHAGAEAHPGIAVRGDGDPLQVGLGIGGQAGDLDHGFGGAAR